MVNELDLYLDMVSYISTLWKLEGKESKKSLVLNLKINKVLENKELINVQLPYLSTTQIHAYVERIITSYKGEIRKSWMKKTLKEQLASIQQSSIQAINEILILLDDTIDSANQSITLNNQLIEKNKAFIQQKLTQDTSYETENNYSLDQLTKTLTNQNKAFNQTIQSVQVVIGGIEQLLALQKSEMGVHP